jgi:hypothetical protein
LVDGQVIWRAYLMPVPDGKGQGFADLKQLFAYLESLTAQGLPPGSAQEKKGDLA